jgi:3',5'-cyclic AMP phosphodiesterase CpdA
LGPEQMAWLVTELRAAEEAGDRVVVASHIALCTTGRVGGTFHSRYFA